MSVISVIETIIDVAGTPRALTDANDIYCLVICGVLNEQTRPTVAAKAFFLRILPESTAVDKPLDRVPAREKFKSLLTIERCAGCSLDGGDLYLSRTLRLLQKLSQ